MEQTRARHLVWLRRGLETSLGMVLVLVGWAALFALSAVVVLAGEESSGSASSTPASGTVAAVVGILAVVVLTTMILGRRLIGRSRRLVLFLRRFGYTDATNALTFAALKTIGRAWRLVTLDDASVAPVGVSELTAKVSAVGEFGSKWVGRALRAITFLAMWAMGLAVAGMGAAIGYRALHHRSVLAMVGHALARDHAHPKGAAAIFGTCFVVTIVAAGVAMFGAFANLVATLLFEPSHILSLALRRAEEAKVTTIASVDAAHGAAHAMRQQARRVFSPRLMVLHVDSRVWRPTVTTVADVASIVLIDVSEPSENLLWEISEVERDPEIACVLVGNAERLRRLESSDAPLERQLLVALDGRTILAYDTTTQGMRRFGRALRATLEIAAA